MPLGDTDEEHGDTEASNDEAQRLQHDSIPLPGQETKVEGQQRDLDDAGGESERSPTAFESQEAAAARGFQTHPISSQ